MPDAMATEYLFGERYENATSVGSGSPHLVPYSHILPILALTLCSVSVFFALMS